MSKLSPDLINNVSGIQNQIWQAISMSVTEATGAQVSFGNPLTVAAKTADLYAEIGSAMLAVQFCFSNLPDSVQAVLIPQETVLGLANLIFEQESTEVSDETVTDLRPAMEAIVQGVCLAAGQITGETVVASGLSIRYQVFSLPGNLQRSEELVRIQVAVNGDGLNGSAIWLQDTDTAHYLLGITESLDTSEDMPFPQAGEKVTSVGKGAADEHTGLDRLLDIPLEITVELGRMKMLVKDVIELGSGSIVEIEKSAGEPVDVMVNGRLVAKGEVVVIEDNFGVRITEIMNPADRLSRLQDVA